MGLTMTAEREAITMVAKADEAKVKYGELYEEDRCVHWARIGELGLWWCAFVKKLFPDMRDQQTKLAAQAYIWNALSATTPRQLMEAALAAGGE
jgi:hypothetical protein